MNYNNHTNFIKTSFSEMDLLKESEFHFFKNESFAMDCTELCIDLCNHVSEKLKINLYFSIQYNHTFNAKAIVKNDVGVILLNLGLIDKLETIVSDSIEIFSYENIAKFTISNVEKLEMKKLVSDSCLTYLFYHELAHVLQMIETSSNKYNFQEQYSETVLFDIKHHIYELDADHFGALMSAHKILDYASNVAYPMSTILIFNLLTALLFSIGNIIIGFSENKFETIYYKEHSHPHPLIRIMECNEQILTFTSINLAIQKEFFLALLQRTITMMSQIHYSGKGQIDYSKLITDNMSEIESYVNQIETINESYRELIRFRVHDVYNSLFN